MSETGGEIHQVDFESQKIAYKDKVVARYMPVLQELYGKQEGEIKVIPVSAIDRSGQKSEAIRIVIKPQDGKQAGLLMDFDDTAVNTTSRKRALIDEIIPLVPDEKHEEFQRSFQLINDVARSLPDDDLGNHIHTPLLEMRALSKAVQVANRPSTMSPVSLPTTKEEARAFILEEVAEREYIEEWPKVDVSIHEKSQTFKNDYPGATDVNFLEEKPPYGISQKVWESYKATMASPLIEEGEYSNFNTPEDAHFVLATSGVIDYQLEKVVNTIKKLKDRARLPDEIMVFTKGRKNEILNQYAEDSTIPKFVFIDENPNQITSFSDGKSNKITLLLARRYGIKRQDDSVVSNAIPRIQMEITTHKEILALAA